MAQRARIFSWVVCFIKALKRLSRSFQPIAQFFATMGVLNRKKVAFLKCHFHFRCFEKKGETTDEITISDFCMREKPIRISESL